MRIPTSTVLLSLPLLGMAAENEGPFAQYRAQFQDLVGSVGSFLQATAASVGVSEPVSTDAAAGQTAETTDTAGAVVPTRATEKLTLDNWKDTLYSRVQPGATVPEEWWVLITGGNKTCFGRCGVVDAAFAEAAPKLSSIPDGPNTAIVDCEDQPVLCNSWSASAGFLYVFDVLPAPAKTDVYSKRLNMTTTTGETIYELYESHAKDQFESLNDGWFHPLDGTLAVNGLAVPIGYALWFLNIVPSWMMMLLVSFGSRSLMGRRAGPPRPGPAR